MPAPSSNKLLSDREWVEILNYERSHNPSAEEAGGSCNWGYLEALQSLDLIDDSKVANLNLKIGCDSYIVIFDPVSGHPTVSRGNSESFEIEHSLKPNAPCRGTELPFYVTGHRWDVDFLFAYVVEFRKPHQYTSFGQGGSYIGPLQ